MQSFLFMLRELLGVKISIVIYILMFCSATRCVYLDYILYDLFLWNNVILMSGSINNGA